MALRNLLHKSAIDELQWRNESEEAHARLTKLQQLSDNLTLPRVAMAKLEDDCVEYAVETGRCRGKAVLNTSDVAIQIATLDAGTTFQMHNHGDSDEVLVVISGSAVSTTDSGRTQIAGPRGVIKIPSGISHTVFCREATAIVAITIPASEGYPRAGEK